MDLLIGSIASQQHGVVSRTDLLEVGVSRKAINHRMTTGRLHQVHRGVYAVGHRALSADGVRMAAVLAAAPNGVLSHRSAAALWGFTQSSVIEVTANRGRRPRQGIRVRRIPFQPDEVTRVRGIRVTTVPRTLFDLAALLPRHQIERAINEAEVRRLTDKLSLPDLVARYPRRKGVWVIEAILDKIAAGFAIPRHEIESLFLELVDRAGLPRPEVNAYLLVAGIWIECDCVWREHRVIVELDGRATHDTAAAFERDRARDRRLAARGWRLVRITWRQLAEEPEAVASDLRAILEAQAPSSSAIAA
jgi:hypothetical protein